jgi:hypothetical protein
MVDISSNVDINVSSNMMNSGNVAFDILKDRLKDKWIDTSSIML